MSFLDWLSIFTISLLGALSPRPSLIIIVKNTINGGKIGGILTAFAHCIGVGIYAFLTVFGLSILLKENPNIYIVLTYLGAIYLVYLGFQELREKNILHKT